MGKRFLIGVGSYAMGDDGIGLRLVEHISEAGLDKDFTAIDLSHGGVALLDYFTQETEKILIVDAVRGGQEPGEVFFFSPLEVESQKEPGSFSTHEGDLLKTIELARQLKYPIPPITIMAIGPQSMAAGMELSPILKERFLEYVELALKAIRS